MPEDEQATSRGVEADRRAKEFQSAGKIGRGVINVATDRDRNRFTRYLDSTKFPLEATSGVRLNAATEITDEAIQTALRSSFTLALETAAQVTEAQVPRGGQVREDVQSLQALFQILRGGISMANEQRNRGDNTAILTETRKALARRVNVPPEELQVTDEQLLRQFDLWYSSAGKRIGVAMKALEDYLRI